METATFPTVDQFKELVREEWSDPATVAGWRRWFPKMLVQFQTGTDLLLQAARDLGDRILLGAAAPVIVAAAPGEDQGKGAGGHGEQAEHGGHPRRGPSRPAACRPARSGRARPRRPRT